MTLPNPWNPQPFPTHGDEDPEPTFQGVGKVMTAWECLEFELSRLYSVFARDADGPAMRAYGEGKIFRDRVDALRRIAEKKYFVAKPNQTREGCFTFIAKSVEGFSDRRNEVAHGIVFPIHTLTVFRSKFSPSEQGRLHFALIPPYYSGRKHDDIGAPTFMYTSVELQALSARLHECLDSVTAFREKLTSDLP